MLPAKLCILLCSCLFLLLLLLLLFYICVCVRARSARAFAGEMIVRGVGDQAHAVKLLPLKHLERI